MLFHQNSLDFDGIGIKKRGIIYNWKIIYNTIINRQKENMLRKNKIGSKIIEDFLKKLTVKIHQNELVGIKSFLFKKNYFFGFLSFLGFFIFFFWSLPFDIFKLYLLLKIKTNKFGYHPLGGTIKIVKF